MMMSAYQLIMLKKGFNKQGVVSLISSQKQEKSSRQSCLQAVPKYVYAHNSDTS